MPTKPLKAHEGWFSNQDITMYNEIINQLVPQNGVVVEVGTWMGMSAMSISEACRKKNVSLYCVDHWEGSPEHRFNIPRDLFFQFLDGIRRHNFLGNPIIPIIKPSVEAAQLFSKAGRMVDMVFIDAGHDEKSVREDIECWRKLVKKGGWLAGHDYNEGWPDVVKVVNEVFPHAVKQRHGSNIWLANPHA